MKQPALLSHSLEKDSAEQPLKRQELAQQVGKKEQQQLNSFRILF